MVTAIYGSRLVGKGAGRTPDGLPVVMQDLFQLAIPEFDSLQYWVVDRESRKVHGPEVHLKAGGSDERSINCRITPVGYTGAYSYIVQFETPSSLTPDEFRARLKKAIATRGDVCDEDGGSAAPEAITVVMSDQNEFIDSLTQDELCFLVELQSLLKRNAPGKGSPPEQVAIPFTTRCDVMDELTSRAEQVGLFVSCGSHPGASDGTIWKLSRPVYERLLVHLAERVRVDPVDVARPVASASKPCSAGCVDGAVGAHPSVTTPASSAPEQFDLDALRDDVAAAQLAEEEAQVECERQDQRMVDAHKRIDGLRTQLAELETQLQTAIDGRGEVSRTQRSAYDRHKAASSERETLEKRLVDLQRESALESARSFRDLARAEAARRGVSVETYLSWVASAASA